MKKKQQGNNSVNSVSNIRESVRVLIAQKMKFSIKDFFSQDFITFTEEILD